MPFFAMNDWNGMVGGDPIINGRVGHGLWWPGFGGGLVWESTSKLHPPCLRHDSVHDRALCMTDPDVRRVVARALLHNFADDRSQITGARGEVYDYAGDWEQRGQDSRIQGTLTASSVVGASVHYERDVEADKLKWITAKGPSQGNASVAICGVPQGEVELWSLSLTEVRVAFEYDIPDACDTPSIDIEVVPVIFIPSQTICPPRPPRLPSWVPDLPCITTPEIELTGEVQIDAFEFE